MIICSGGRENENLCPAENKKHLFGFACQKGVFCFG
jgi:hypothetical protein